VNPQIKINKMIRTFLMKWY